MELTHMICQIKIQSISDFIFLTEFIGKLVLYFFVTSMLQVQCNLIFKVFTTFKNCEFHVKIYT
jgi:hypothetical protein